MNVTWQGQQRRHDAPVSGCDHAGRQEMPPDPAAGTSPPPTRCTPGILIPPRSWDHDSFSATAPHDARHASPRCSSAPRLTRTQTKTTTPLDAATPGTSLPSWRSRTYSSAPTLGCALDYQIILLPEQCRPRRRAATTNAGTLGRRPRPRRGGRRCDRVPSISQRAAEPAGTR
jgi:hypothetical protein